MVGIRGKCDGVGNNGLDENDIDNNYCHEVEISLRPIIPRSKDATSLRMEVTYVSTRVRLTNKKEPVMTIVPFPRWMPHLSSTTTIAKNKKKNISSTTSLTNLSVSISYDSTSSTSSSSNNNNNNKIPSMPVGTRIHATFLNDSSNDDGNDNNAYSEQGMDKVIYSNVIRLLSSSNLILSCASMDSSIWRPRMHSITHYDSNKNNHCQSSYATALPQHQPSKCHDSIIQRIMTTTNIHQHPLQTSPSCNPMLFMPNSNHNKQISLWLNYNKDSLHTQEQKQKEIWTEGFQYTLTLPLDDAKPFVTWNNIFHSSSINNLHCSPLSLADSTKVFFTISKDDLSLIQMTDNFISSLQNMEPNNTDNDDNNTLTYVIDYHDIELDNKNPIFYFKPQRNEETTAASSTAPIERKIGIQRTILRPRGLSNTGTLQTRIYYQRTNLEYNSTEIEPIVPLKLLDFFPRVIRPIWHSMKLEFVQQPGAGDEHFIFQKRNNNFIKQLDPITDTTQRRLTHIDGHSMLELSTSILQPDSSLYVSVDYDFSLLAYDDYPPDPNQGIHIPSSYITTTKEFFGTTHYTSNYNNFWDNDNILFSNALIILPPVPDMSMPFNVCGLTTTLQNFVFVSILTFSIRKASERIKDKLAEKNEKPLTWKQKIKQKIHQKLPFLFPKSK